MNLTKRGEYALRSLIRIGLARELGRDFVTVTELAQVEHLPVKFVEQILGQLRLAGYIDASATEPENYRITQDMATIRMADIIRLIDGRLAPIACASESFYERCSCPDEEHCGLRMLMIDVRNAIVGILERYSLANIVEVTLRKIHRDGVASPFEAVIDLPGFTSQQADRRHADPNDGFLAVLNEEEK